MVRRSRSEDEDKNRPATWQFIFAYTVLLSSISCLLIIFFQIDGGEVREENSKFWELLKIPWWTVGGAKQIGSIILEYKDEHYYSVFGAYFATYILLQSLCIPGSLVLSILAGYLFPAPLALLVICTCSTLGASTFYILIYNWRQPLISFFSRGNNSRVDRFNKYVREKVRQYKSNLFLCVFILRATPIFPNWSINLFSPLINLPLKPFVLGTFTGVAPLSVIHVWTGLVLNDLSNDQSLVNRQSILMTSLVAISIGSIVYVRRIA